VEKNNQDQTVVKVGAIFYAIAIVLCFLALDEYTLRSIFRFVLLVLGVSVFFYLIGVLPYRIKYGRHPWK